jgi:hypothetical protein
MSTTGFPASYSLLLHTVPKRTVPAAVADGSQLRAQIPDNTLLPEQFFGPRANVGAVCPEAALMRAVLEDALLCLQGHFLATGRRGQRLAQEAEAWFLSEDVHWPFAFVSICEVLGLEPVAVREALLHDRSSWKSIPLKKIRRSVTAPRAVRLSV